MEVIIQNFPQGFVFEISKGSYYREITSDIVISNFPDADGYNITLKSVDNTKAYLTNSSQSKLSLTVRAGAGNSTTYDYSIVDNSNGTTGVNRIYYRVTNFASRFSPMLFDFSNVMVTRLVSEPEYVGVYYGKDPNLTVSYSDGYGTPIYHNSGADFDDVNVSVGDRINFNANSGYEIKEIRIKQSDEYGTPYPDFVATPDSDYYSITISYDMIVDGKIELSFIVDEEEVIVEPEVIILNVDLSESENVTTSLDGLSTIQYTKGTLFEFTANANEGYIFTGANGSIQIYDGYGTPISPNSPITGTGRAIQFALNLDSITDVQTNWTIKISLSPDYVGISDVNNFINLYRTNQGELNLLSSKRYGYDNGTFIDYGERITNLFRLPIQIPEEIIIPDETIKLGDYDTEVESSLINNYIMYIEVDRISVPEIYGNSLDYAGVICELFLPFISSIDLPADYVINQEVTIKYVLNLLSGDVTVNLYSSKTGELFKTFNEQIAMSLPFVQGISVRNPIGQVQTVSLNENRLAYIQVTRNRIANENGVGFSVDATGRLVDYTGYVEVENIQLNTHATLSEIEEIKNILRSGVFINE